uniref:F-ATPase protein 6 n=1 Tax=Gesiella jameensis TaxID=1960709 RepID=A0A8E7IV31_9ANNE|nr:ATP synthase F0 subunit 6 [Gesiella jameensis]
MMLDIFSSFDPLTFKLMMNLSPSLFWMLNFTIMFILYPSMNLTSTRMNNFMLMPLMSMLSQSMRTLSIHMKGLTSIITLLFLFLILMNLLGILPYVFSYSSHLTMTLSLGLPLWLSMILSAMFYSPKLFTTHLLPAGAPQWLNPFLILTETLSMCVRFITLSFRLAANMSAGHILLTLMGITTSSFFLMNSYNLTLSLILELSYLIFEMGICLIQAYVFCLLLTLYSNDHPMN